MNVAFYLRGTGQEEQEALCREYGLLRYGIDDGRVLIFRDGANTGGRGGARPEPPDGLKRLQDKAREGALRAVICSEMGVLCRSVGNMLETARYFDSLGVALLFAKERLDTSSAAGRALLYISELMLELENKAAASVIRENMLALARTGRWLGGTTPTGYIPERAEPGRPESLTLKLHPPQAETVRLIYSMFLELDSLAKVAGALESRGITSKNGRKFTRFTLRQILENPVYMQADADAFAYFSGLGAEVCSPEESFDGKRGMMVYNKTSQRQGEPAVQREPREWIAAVGGHPGIVAAESWIAVQKQLERNKPGTPRKPKSDCGLLAGILYCGDCGAYMRPKTARRQDSPDRTAFSYICEGKERGGCGGCDMPNLPGNQADDAICVMLSALGPDEPDILPQTRERPVTPQALAGHRARMQEKRGLIAKNEETASALVFSLVNVIDKSAYKNIIRQIEALNEQSSKARAELSVMESLSSPHPMENVCRESLKELLEDWEGAHSGMSIARRRAALRALIESVTWEGGELIAHFTGGAVFAVTPGGEGRI